MQSKHSLNVQPAANVVQHGSGFMYYRRYSPRIGFAARNFLELRYLLKLIALKRAVEQKSRHNTNKAWEDSVVLPAHDLKFD